MIIGVWRGREKKRFFYLFINNKMHFKIQKILIILDEKKQRKFFKTYPHSFVFFAFCYLAFNETDDLDVFNWNVMF